MLDKISYSNKLCELKYNLSVDLRNLRMMNNLSIDELEEKTRINRRNLQNMEIGNVKDWNLLIDLAKFYKKKVKIEFY